jgi:cytochrome P450
MRGLCEALDVGQLNGLLAGVATTAHRIRLDVCCILLTPDQAEEVVRLVRELPQTCPLRY